MNYQTEMKAINIQVLQSVLYNIEKDIPSIKITLQFDDEDKYKRFSNKIAPVSNQEEDVVSNSDSDDLLDANQQSNKSTNDQESSSLVQQKYVEKLSRLQLSIILKENYQQKIQKISKETGVRILIVPEKLKFFGASYESIEQAKSLVHEIKTNIMISTLQKYGKEAYESNYIRQKLNKQGIKLGKLSQKYYYWYDESTCNLKFIQSVIEDIFQRNVHVFHPLVQNYQNLKRVFNKKYIDALIKANVKLYEYFLESQLNEDKNNDHKIQLNIDRTETIIHIKVLQQAQILKQGIKKFYSELIQFYIHFKEDTKINEIQTVLNQRDIMWCRHEDIFVISFNKNTNYRGNQSLGNLSVIVPKQTREKEFLESLLCVFELDCNCYIEYLEQQAPSEEQKQQKKKLFKSKIQIEYKKMDGLVVITPVNRRPKLFVQIIDLLVLKPKSQKQKVQKAAQTVNKTIDQGQKSSMIHDTTSKIQQTNNEMSMNEGDKSIIGAFSKHKDQSILAQIRQNLLFNQYKAFIKDIQGEKKYDGIDELQKGKGKFKGCQELQNQLQEISKRKYKPYLVNVPEKYKVQLEQSNDMITVFMRDSDKQFLNQKIVFVYLLTDERKIISTNGWLLNISKSKIIDNNNKLEATIGTFEIIFYVKYIEQGY